VIDQPPFLDPVLNDIDKFYGVGLNAFVAECGETENALFRLRRAYDTAWQHLYGYSFDSIERNPGLEPLQLLEQALANIWDIRNDSTKLTYANFALTCYWTKGLGNEIELIFKDDAQFYYETEFTQQLTEACSQAGLTGAGEYESPEQVAQMLLQYIATVFLTWQFMPSDKELSVEEAHLGALGILHGHGPTQFS
jgi:hypothetical protein